MRKTALIVSLLLVGTLSPALAVAEVPAPTMDSVAEWNGLALTAVHLLRASDADAARLYAMVNVAIYDAVNGVADQHSAREPALVPGPGPRQADPQAAAVAAAHAVLVGLDGARAADYDRQLAADLDRLRRGSFTRCSLLWAVRFVRPSRCRGLSVWRLRR